MMSVLWHWKEENTEAEIFRVNGLYQYRIYLRWMGRYGFLVQGKEISRGHAASLCDAKRIAFNLMANHK